MKVTQPYYWQVRWLDKADCLDSSVVNREKKMGQNGFCFILRWVDRKGKMTHLLGLHLCLYSLWRKLSDELSQGPTSWIAWAKSHSEHLWQTRLLLEEMRPCNNCLQKIQKIWCAAIFEDKDPDSFCVPHPYLGFKPEGDAGGEHLQKHDLPNHASGLAERNLAVYYLLGSL